MGRYPYFSSRPAKLDLEIVQESMRWFGILHFADRDYTTLSGGERQRVQFARIMAQIWPGDDTHRILFLDEPLTFLDVKYQYDFLKKIRNFIGTQNLTVIGVLHDLNLAARFADKQILLKEGELIVHGDQKTVLTSEHIRKAYGMEPRLIEAEGRLIIDF